MIKTNLIVDGNYLMYKSVFILSKTRSIKTDLLELLKNDFNKIIRSYPFDNIYLVSDKGSSWRKLEYKEYKGTRQKDETIDWDLVYKIYSEFKEITKKRKNVKFFEKDKIEGDDFIAYLVHESNKENVSNVIIASDKDINQLLHFDMINKYINIQWNYKFSDERVYVPENYQLFLDHLSKNKSEDIFEPTNEHEFINFIETLANRTKIKEIRNEESLFCKIVSGDTGDNIKTIIKIKDGKIIPNNQDGRGIGEDGAKSLYKLFKETYPNIIDFDSDIFVNQLVDVVFYFKKIKDFTHKSMVSENIKFNRRMVMLDDKYMPEMIFEAMNSEYQEVKNRVVEYEEIDLEEELVKKGFYDEKKDIKPEFRKEIDGEFKKMISGMLMMKKRNLIPVIFGIFK